MTPKNNIHTKKQLTLKTWIRNNLLAGVAVLMPVLGTLWFFLWVVNNITQAGLEIMKRMELRVLIWDLDSFGAKILARAFVLIVMIGLVILIGLLAKNFFGRRLLRLGEIIIEKIPIINRIYIALKQISNAFWGQDKTIFKQVILVEYPRRGLYALAFVTSENTGEIDEKISGKLLNVFLPTTPNPTSGYFLMVPEKKAIRLAMSVEDGMKMVISGGAVMPEEGLQKMTHKEHIVIPGLNEAPKDTVSDQQNDSKNIDSQEV